MFESIPAFSIVLGHHGAKFSREEEERRKQAIREEIKVLVPASRHLLHSALKEHVFAEGDKIVLTYDLVESSQLFLELDAPDSSNSKLSPIIVYLIDDLRRLRDSAEFTQIRILELAQISTALITGGADNNSLGNLSEEDYELWKFMRSKRGQVRSITFTDGDVFFQIPLFPAFVPEQFTRRVSALVSSMSPASATLISVNETGEIPANLYHPPLPRKSMKLHHPINKSNNYFWHLLYAAMVSRAPIEADVRVALHIDSLKPGYLELHGLANTDQLLMKFDSLRACII